MNPLTILLITFLSPLLLILLVDRQSKDWLVHYLNRWDLLRALRAFEYVAIMVAIIAFLWDLPVRRETLKAFKEEREARAWSLIYQAKDSSGDGGRRYALEYLHKEKGASLASLPLQNSRLVGVQLPGAKLNNAILNKAVLHEANLQGADLESAKLIKANLNKTNLSKAKLLNAELIEATLHEANLQGANLEHVNLRKAQLNDANLSGVNLKNAQYLEPKQLESAFYCEQFAPPTLPDGLKLPPMRKCGRDVDPIEE